MTSRPVDKLVPELELMAQPEEYWTFAYPLGIVPTLQPELYTRYPFLSITREEGVISVVVALPVGGERNAAVEVDGQIRGIVDLGKAVESHGPWRVIKIRGPLPMHMTGILNEMTLPLRRAEIGIYAISTWPTDHVLVPADKLDAALGVLQADGWKVSS
ncbi:hypothetical protein IAU60_006293 [Kwoniella sp. DSM 27419]